MAPDQEEPQARYPKVDPASLPEGAEHGYIGKVQVYDPEDPGHSNIVVGKAPKESASKPAGKAGTIKADDTEDDS